MAIVIKCGECGKQFQGKDELAGKKIKCPACSAIIAAPPAGTATKPAPAKTAEKPESIAIACGSCGKKFQGKAALAGKRVKCPGCGEAIAVPGGVAAAAAPAHPAPAPARSTFAAPVSMPALSTMSSLLDEEFAAGNMPELPKAGQTLCPSCRKIMPASAALCTNCGFDVRAGKSIVTTKDAIKKRRPYGKHTPLGKVVAVFNILYGVVLAGLFAWGGVMAVKYFVDNPFDMEGDPFIGGMIIAFPVCIVLGVAGVLFVTGGIGVFRTTKGAANNLGMSSGIVLGFTFFAMFFAACALGINYAFASEPGAAPAVDEKKSASLVSMMDGETFLYTTLICGALASMPFFTWLWWKVQGGIIDIEIPDPSSVQSSAAAGAVVDVTKRPTLDPNRLAAPKVDENLLLRKQGYTTVISGIIINIVCASIGAALFLFTENYQVLGSIFMGAGGFIGLTTAFSGNMAISESKGYGRMLGAVLAFFCNGLGAMIVLSILKDKTR